MILGVPLFLEPFLGSWKRNGERMNICAIGSINSHYFHIIGDGHQPNSRGIRRCLRGLLGLIRGLFCDYYLDVPGR